MIKCLYGRDLSFRIVFNNCLTIYRNSQLYSTIKMGTSALRHSKFSEFMGLASELRKLEKQEQKTERSQIRFNMFIITTCLIGFSCAAVFLYGDASVRLKWSIFTKKIQLGFSKGENLRKTIVEGMLDEITIFLKEHPYDYLNILGLLNDVLCEADKVAEHRFVQEALTRSYEFILQRNHKARSSKQFLQGVASLLERSIIHNRKWTNRSLLKVLLEQGSIKQMYLALRCINPNQIDSQSKDNVRKNLQNQIQKSEKYFNTIFDSIKEQELPQISSKKAQVSQWYNQINLILN